MGAVLALKRKKRTQLLPQLPQETTAAPLLPPPSRRSLKTNVANGGALTPLFHIRSQRRLLLSVKDTVWGRNVPFQIP